MSLLLPHPKSISQSGRGTFLKAIFRLEQIIIQYWSVITRWWGAVTGRQENIEAL